MKEKITPGKIVLIAAAVCVIFCLFCILESEPGGAIYFFAAFVVLLVVGISLDWSAILARRVRKKNLQLSREIEENMARVREQERSNRQ